MSHPQDQVVGCHIEPLATAEGNMMSMKLLLLVIGVCFTAVGAALQALQTSKPLPINGFSLVLQFACMALELSFLSAIVPLYIHPTT